MVAMARIASAYAVAAVFQLATSQPRTPSPKGGWTETIVLPFRGAKVSKKWPKNGSEAGQVWSKKNHFF